MLQEEKYFNGAVQDSDNAIEYTQPNAILDGLNVRIQTQEGNKQGLIVTLEGNREIARTLPTGTNTVLRSKYFPEVGKAYIFTKNSNGRHRIEEFDVQSETFITIFEDLTDSGSKQLLDWTGAEYIKDVVLVDGNLLYWNQFPQDIVLQINLTMAKSSGYGVVVDSDLYLTTPPPLSPPQVTYHNSPDWASNTTTYNNLKGKLFQFRHRYVYNDGRVSAWSPISKRPTPTSELDSQGNVVYNDIIGITLAVPSDKVKTIEISARDGGNPWYTIRVVDRDDILNMPTVGVAEEIPNPNPPPPNILVFRYDIEGTFPLGNTYYYPFRNDGLYPQDDQLEHDLIADDVPHTARALSLVNGNAILLGNFKKGYNAPQINDSEVSVEVSYYPAEIAPSQPNDLRLLEIFQTLGESATRYELLYSSSSVPQIGDTLYAAFRRGADFTVIEKSFSVTSAEAGNLTATLNAFIAELMTITEFSFQQAPHIETPPDGVSIVFRLSGASMTSYMAKVELSSSPNLMDISYGAIKTGSSYELAVAYYDRYGRPFPLYTNPNLVFSTDYYPQNNGLLPQANWQLPTDAPSGAASYHILASPNRTHEANWVTLATLHDTTTPDYYVFDISSLFDFFGEQNSGQSAYDYAPGDYVNVICNVLDDSTYTNWQDSPVRTLEVLSQRVEVDNTDPNDPITSYLIKVPRPSTEITDPDETYLIEIIRPRKSMQGDEEKVFYEISEEYPIINGEHSVTSGSIKSIDSYLKVRRMNDTSDTGSPSRTLVVESFHFSDNYVSNYYSFGRPRVKGDVPEAEESIADIVWSQEYNRRTNKNNLNRFYPENTYSASAPYYGASEDYGGIQYLSIRENRMLCLQELKVGYIPVNRSIISDAVEQQQVAISQYLLNPIQYSIGPNMGIGKDYAIPSYEYVNGAAYFIDPHEMLPVRAGLDGTRYIQSTYSGEMKRKIREMVTSGNYIFSVWDDRMNEWLVVFNDYTYVYDEKSNGWIPKRSYLPSSGFTANDRLYTTNGNGQLYIHDDESNRNRFYGVDYPAELKFPITSPRVKTYQSIALHMDDEVETVEDGIETQLGHVSDLVVDDFTWREGIRYANFLRDKNSGTDITNGDRLKGRWITLHLVQEAPVGEWNLLKAVMKSSLSTPGNE